MAAPNNMEFDQVAPFDLRRSAARTVASLASDATECAELLGMLGLTAEDGAGARAAEHKVA